MSKAKQHAVELDYPLKRGEQEVKTITLRRPSAGELRGTSLVELMNMNTDALIKILPRVSSPALTEQELKQIDPADLVQLGSELVGFLLPKRAKEAAAE